MRRRHSVASQVRKGIEIFNTNQGSTRQQLFIFDNTLMCWRLVFLSLSVNFLLTFAQLNLEREAK